MRAHLLAGLVIGSFLTPIAFADEWVTLVTRDVSSTDQVRVPLGRELGSFSKVRVSLEGSSVQLVDFAVQFVNGGPGPQNWHPTLRLREALDLPGTNRTLRWIEFRLGSPTHARVRVEGFRVGGKEVADGGVSQPASAQQTGQSPGPAEEWDSTGWSLVEDKVDAQQPIRSPRLAGAKEVALVAQKEFELSIVKMTFASGGRGLSAWSPFIGRGSRKVWLFKLPAHSAALASVSVATKQKTSPTSAKFAVWVR